jgi:hypothetical protein
MCVYRANDIVDGLQSHRRRLPERFSKKAPCHGLDCVQQASNHFKLDWAITFRNDAKRRRHDGMGR